MVLGLSFWMMICSGWRRAGSCIIKASGKADSARASHCDRTMCKSASVAPGLAHCCAPPTMKQAAAKSRSLFFVMVPASKRKDGGETVEPMEAFLAPFAAPLPLDCLQADGPGRGPRAEGVCPAPGADQARCARDRKHGPTIRMGRTEPSRPAGVKGGRRVGNRGRWGRLWSEGAGDAAPPPAHRTTGGGGLIMITPSDFFLAGVGFGEDAS
jgi:hypothetical protein